MTESSAGLCVRGDHAKNCAEKSDCDEYIYLLFITNTNTLNSNQLWIYAKHTSTNQLQNNTGFFSTVPMHGFAKPHEPNCLAWPRMTVLSSILALQTWITALNPVLQRETLLWEIRCLQSPTSYHQWAGEWTSQRLLRNDLCEALDKSGCEREPLARRENAALSFLYKKFWDSTYTPRTASAAGLYS